jgi:hypothetical protein
MKNPITVRFAFNGWEKNGVNVYNTEKGIELSMNDFHSGTVFHGILLLDEEHSEALAEALEQGFTPSFLLFESGP